jgi:SSS family solute:Na+ symporter
MTRDTVIVLTVLAAFYLMNAIILKLSHRPQTSIEEYGVGGRSIGWLTIAFSHIGGWFVGATYTGWFAFSADLGVFAQYLIIYSISCLFIMYVMAKPVWSWGKEFNLETQADIIQLRYKSLPFTTVVTVLVSVVSSAWLVVEMVTLGYIVSAATNNAVPFNVGTALMGSGVILYSVLGGARASAQGALIQGMTFAIAGSITFYFLIAKAYGGVIPLLELVERNRPSLLVLDPEKHLDIAWMSAILTGTLGAYCWPSVFSRLFMTSSPRDTKKGVLVAPAAAISIAVAILWFGLGGRMVPGFPVDAQGGIFWMANHFGGPEVLGLVAVYASAAAVATISASANAIAMLLAKNVVGVVTKDAKAILAAAKISTVVLGVGAMLIATIKLPQLITIALAMYDCISQIIVPLFLGLVWRRGNLAGAVIGTTVGVLIAAGSLLFPVILSLTGGVSGGVVGLIANITIYVGCGIIFKQAPHVERLFEILDDYDEDGINWKSREADLLRQVEIHA